METKIISEINDGTLEYSQLSKELKHNPSITIVALRKKSSNINYLPKIFFDNFDIMLQAVQLNGFILQKVSDDLIQNRNIVHAAVKQNGLALNYVFNYETDYEEEYDEDYDSYHMRIIKTFMGRDIIDDSRQYLVRDYEIVLAAVTQNGMALDYASKDLQNNFDIVLAAVKQNGESIKFSSDELQDDKEIILTAIESNYDAIHYISPDLKIQIEEILHNVTIGNMNYFYNKIKNGSLLPCAKIWIYKLSKEQYNDLLIWIEANMYTYKSLFNVLFYKCNSFDKKLGSYDTVRESLLSYLVPDTDLHQKHSEILNDIFHFE